MSYGAIYKDILREYAQRREQKARELDVRRAAVYEAVPRIREIDDELAGIGIALVKSALSDAARADGLSKQSTALQKEKTRLLTEAGYKRGYLNEEYDCEKCNDTGYTGDKRCACFTQKIIDRHYGLSNLQNRLGGECFENFDIRYYADEKDPKAGISPKANMERIYRVCTQFVKDFDKTSANLLFYGDTGLGKTFLCNCIAKDLLNAGKTVLYATAPQLFKFYEDCRFNKDELTDPRGYADMVLSCDLLIIDDLGTEFVTVCGASELFNIVNSRILDKKHTVISTNLNPGADFEDTYSQRIVSRLVGDYIMLKFIGTDIRMQKKYT